MNFFLIEDELQDIDLVMHEFYNVVVLIKKKFN